MDGLMMNFINLIKDMSNIYNIVYVKATKNINFLFKNSNYLLKIYTFKYLICGAQISI
jgi:hypothetical protein